MRFTLKAAKINRLEAFEMKLQRKRLRIPRNAMQANEAVLNRTNPVQELFETIKIRKIYLGHVLRGEKVLQLIMKGKVEGSRCVERKEMLKNIHGSAGIRSAEQLSRLSETREQLVILIANIRET